MPVPRWRSGVASGLRALADRLEAVGGSAGDGGGAAVSRGGRGADDAVAGLLGGGTAPAGLDLAGAPAHWLDRLLAAGVITAGPVDDAVGPRDVRLGADHAPTGLPGSMVERPTAPEPPPSSGPPPSPEPPPLSGRSPSGDRRGRHRPRLRLPVRPPGDVARVPGSGGTREAASGTTRIPDGAPGTSDGVPASSGEARGSGAGSRSMPRLRLPGSDAGSVARSSSRDRRPNGRDERAGAARERTAGPHDAHAPLGDPTVQDRPVTAAATGAAGRGEAPPTQMPRRTTWPSRERTGADQREAGSARRPVAPPPADGGLSTSREPVDDAGQGRRGLAAGARAGRRLPAAGSEPPAALAEPHPPKLPADSHRGTPRAGYADRISASSRDASPPGEPGPRPMGERSVAPPTATDAVQVSTRASVPDTRDPWPTLPARPAETAPALPRVELALARAVRLVHEQAAV